MKRSTNSAPDSLSTSYFTGSAFIGISMMTLNSCGTLSPAVTLLMLIYLGSFLGADAGAADPHTIPFRWSSRLDAPSVEGDRARSAACEERRPADLRQRAR